MKIIRFLIVGAIGICLGAIAMALYISFNNFINPDPWIVVHVRNNSSQDVVGISINNENGSIEHKGVRKGSEVRIPVSQFGEGNYTVKFILKNGLVCGSENGYIESGSETTEWITDEGVINDVYKQLGHEPNKCVN